MTELGLVDRRELRDSLLDGENYIDMHYAEVIANDGREEQRNFDGYSPPYMKDAPTAVDVHILPSGDKPTGCGEPPVPVIAPAVVNALARLTGTLYRTLPLPARL